jgi:hypothetical protein
LGPIKYLKDLKEKHDIKKKEKPFFDGEKPTPTATDDELYKQRTSTWVAPSKDASAFWEEIKADLAMQLPGATFDANVRSAKAVRYDGQTLTIVGSSIFAVDFLQGRLTPIIQRTMAQHARHPVTLEVIEAKNASD